MKKNMKTTVMTMMVVGMTVSGTAGVFAGTNLQKITAYLNSSIGIKVNGQAFSPTDSNGNKLRPIFYHDSAYLPVKAIANALHVPVTYDSKNGQILIGSAVTGNLVDVSYSSTQTAEIIKAFSGFANFESAYVPKLMLQGDTFLKAAATEDGVNLVFNHMNVNVSPRDYSDGYDSKPVTLSNGTQAKWFKPGETDLLVFKLNDRFVTVSSPDQSISQSQLEKIAVSVASQATPSVSETDVKYSAEQLQAIKKEFAQFESFETAYVQTRMITGDAYKSALAAGDGVNLVFTHMVVNVSPRDYSFEYDGTTTVRLANGTEAKWYKPGETDMLTFKLDDRFVTISSPDHALTKLQLEKVALGVAKSNS